MILDKIKKYFKSKTSKKIDLLSNKIDEYFNQIKYENEQLKIVISSMYKNSLILNKKKLCDYEYKIFSQWGEDGIIQFLVSRINIKHKIFVEIGVENYLESNTRFLLINNNWKGLIIDGNKEQILKVKNQEIMWKYDINLVDIFVTKDNINSILEQNDFLGNIGLLSIDIDGNDYWLWDSIKVINPDIVVCEYQAMWGFDKSVTIPYQEDFVRSRSEYHNIYYSTSLPALIYLAKGKGYTYIGSNKVGTNAFFVKNEFRSDFNDLDINISEEKPGVREFVDKNGTLTYELGSKKLSEISHLPLYNVETDMIDTIANIYNIKNEI